MVAALLGLQWDCCGVWSGYLFHKSTSKMVQGLRLVA
jgi:hypothetical protein